MIECDVIRHDNVELSDGKKIRLYELNEGLYNENLRVPSVTTILGLVDTYKDWKKNTQHSYEITTYATTVGTLGHWRFQNQLSKEWDRGYVELELSSSKQFYYDKWFNDFPYSETEAGIKFAIDKIMSFYPDWKEKYKPKPPYIEITEKGGKKVKKELNINPFEYNAFSKKFGYAGSIDILASIMENHKRLGLCIVDIKTTKRSKPSYKMQCVAYKLAFEEMNPEYTIQDTRILYLPKNTLDWDYTMPKFRKGLEHYRIQWLQKVAEFYLVYGDQEPLSYYSEDVLRNVEKEGIELSELDIQNYSDYEQKQGISNTKVTDKNKFLKGIR